MKKLPESVRPYQRTPEFDQDTVPAGLLKRHQTKAGTWGRIVVLSGQLHYRILAREPEEHLLDADNPGIVEPEIPHEVAPAGPVRFFVEFNR